MGCSSQESASSDIILVLCANKSDLIKQENVNEEEARNYAKELGAIFCSTSAKNDYGISDLFIQIAKKYSGNDDITIKNDNDDIPVNENEIQNERSKKRGSVRITGIEKNKKEEKKKKCC